MKTFLKRTASALIFSAFFVSCTSMVDYDYSNIDSKVAEGNFSLAMSKIEEDSEKIYSSRSELLYELDTGLLAHWDNSFKISNEHLTNAEQLIDSLSARSISQTALSLVSNDLAQDYSGEDFEDIYTNLTMALNYLAMGNPSEAMVEVRRFNNKTRDLREKYSALVSLAEKSDNVEVDDVSVQFYDSCLARWLSMLLYRTEGDISNAELDLKMLKSAFYEQNQLYDFDIPSTIDDEISVPRGKARINVLAFTGRAPLKKENATRIYYPKLAIWYKISLPELYRLPSEITEVKITIENTETGKVVKKTAEKIESLEAIFEDTFKRHLALIKAKSIARSVARAATSTTMDVLAAKSANDGNAGATLLFGALGIFSKAYTEGIERADIRTSRYFPASALISGITVEPGEYEVTIDFLSGNKVVNSKTTLIEAISGDINLVEANCLK